MKYVKLTVVNNKYFVCKTKECKFRQEFSLHESAVDYRSEDGFSPEIIKRDSTPVFEGLSPIESFYCTTVNQPMAENIGICLPENHNELERGQVYVKDIVKKKEDKQNEFAKTIEELNTENTKLLAGPNAPKHKATNEVWQTQLQVAILSQLIAITRILMKDES